MEVGALLDGEVVFVGDGEGEGGGAEEGEEGKLDLPFVDGFDGGIGAVEYEEELEARGEGEAIAEIERVDWRDHVRAKGERGLFGLERQGVYKCTERNLLSDNLSSLLFGFTRLNIFILYVEVNLQLRRF